MGERMDQGMEDGVGLLRRCDLLAGVPMRGLHRLWDVATEVLIPRHEAAYRAGDTQDAFYVLRQGLVCISMPINPSRNVVIALHGPGRAFGWGALIGDLGRLHSALALADSVAWVVPLAALRELADHDPESSASLYRNVSAMTFRLLVSTRAHINGAPRLGDHIERCPALVANSFFNWRLNGTIIEAKCPGRPACGATPSSCPLVNGPASEWANLMLGKYGSILATSPG